MTTHNFIFHSTTTTTTTRSTTMAASAAAAAVGSYLSPSIHSFKCAHYSTSHSSWPLDYSSFKMSLSVPTRMLASVSHTHGLDHVTVIGASKWRVPTSVAQEETTVEDTQEEVTVKEEEEEVAAVNTKLYFGNLPYNIDSAQLAGMIQEYANPELIEVLYDRNTGKSRGFAFVTMSSVEDCNAVIQNLDGNAYLGRPMRVNFADKPRAKEPLYPETEYKLFVGNLAWTVTSESLTEAFQEYGNVIGARVLYDGETGRSRGYGFICYSTKSEMDTALQSLHGVELEGRAMRVSLAEGRKL